MVAIVVGALTGFLSPPQCAYDKNSDSNPALRCGGYKTNRHGKKVMMMFLLNAFTAVTPAKTPHYQITMIGRASTHGSSLFGLLFCN